VNRARKVGAVGAVLLLPALVLAQPAPSLAHSATSIVQNMVAVQRRDAAQGRAYTVVRNYELWGHGPQARQAEVLTRVDFVPPDRKSFAILRQRGSGRGASVVRRLLEGEVESSASNGASEISERNYQFAYTGQELLDGRRCEVLRVEPRRQERNLLRGRVWVDASTYRLVRLEGEPARNPSWWVKATHVTINFAERDGRSLPVASTMAADVRLFGPHLLTWHEVSYQGQPAPVAADAKPRGSGRWGLRRPVPAVIEPPLR